MKTNAIETIETTSLDIQQIRSGKMDVFSYLVGDKQSRACALIDPVEPLGLLSFVKKSGYTVTHVINTHYHFDHTAGNDEVLKSTRAKLLIHQKDAVPLKKITTRFLSWFTGGKGSPRPDILLKDGDEIKTGRLSLTILHTPGHTPGGICIYIAGHLFTGDTLFVGSIGRTDLPGGSHKMLLNSIHEKIYSLPGDTCIWPGHDYGPLSSSTVYREKKTNPFT